MHLHMLMSNTFSWLCLLIVFQLPQEQTAFSHILLHIFGGMLSPAVVGFDVNKRRNQDKFKADRE